MPRTPTYIEKLDSPVTPPLPLEADQITESGAFELLRAIAAPCACEKGRIGNNGKDKFPECQQHPLDRTRERLGFVGPFTRSGWRKNLHPRAAAQTKLVSVKMSTPKGS